MRRPLFSGLAILTLASSAAAKDPSWELGPKEQARYRIKTDAPQAGASPIPMPAALALRATDFEAGRRYAKEVRGFDDLLLSYALTLPSVSKRGVKMGGTHEDLRPYSVSLQSLAKVTGERSGKVVTYKGEVRLGPSPGKGSYTLKEGRFSYTTVFDTAQGCATGVAFDLDLTLTVTLGSGVRETRLATRGRLVFIEKGVRDPKDLLDDINAAITSGAESLKSKGATMRSSMGPLALQLFALLRSGIPADDPVIVDGFKALAAMSLERTYDVSLAIMALEAKTVTRTPPSPGSTVPRFDRGPVAKADLDRIQTLADWLVEGRNLGKGTWHYTQAKAPGEGGARVAGGFDNSNTQFAILALHAAHRAGARVPPIVWKECFDHFRLVQCHSEGKGEHRIGRAGEEAASPGATVARGPGSAVRGPVDLRGWAYTQPGNAYGSMTNAGLSSLAIAADMLKSAKALDRRDAADFERMVAEGLSWMARHYSVTENPGLGHESWYYYYMYSFEKACELLDVASFDGRDWYLEGADQLVLLQGSDGSWASPNDSALALLFLNRATLRTTLNILPRRATTGAGGAAEGQRDAVLIEAAGGLVSLSAILAALPESSSKEARERRDWFEEGLLRLEDVVRPLLLPRLIALLEDRGTRSWARKQIREITQDSRMRDAEDAQPFYDLWRRLDEAPDAHAYEDIPAIGEVIAESKHVVLRKLAMLTAVRLRAVELAETIAIALEDRHLADIAASCLAALTHASPKTASEVKDWAASQLDSALAAERPRRRVAAALKGDAPSREAVVKGGKADLGALVELARDARLGEAACELLARITGLTLAADDWGPWWREHADEVGADGKAPKPAAPKPASAPGKGG